MHRKQFASDKNFEHAHRCYDQALQMNPDSVSTRPVLPRACSASHSTITRLQAAAWLCKARALFAASTFDDAIQVVLRLLFRRVCLLNFSNDKAVYSA